MDQRGRRTWWNSLSFESHFKRRQLGRVLAFTIAYVAVSTVAVVVGLHFSHNLAKPIYRFKLELQRIAEGRDWRTISPRKRNDFHDVADVLNHALGHVRSTEDLLRQQLEHAEHRFQGLRQALRDHPNDRHTRSPITERSWRHPKAGRSIWRSGSGPSASRGCALRSES